jgi:hypothetical protein
MISMNLNDCRQKDRDRAEIAAAMARSNIKPTQAPADYRAADFHRALVLPGSIDHGAEKRRGRK